MLRSLIVATAAVLAAGYVVAPAPGQAAGKAKTPSAACQRADFRLVVDVGHTAEAPGAISSRGVGEYVFNLRLGQSVHRALIDSGFTKTILLITEGKSRPSLAKRVDAANRSSADLFLSIHHDSVPERFLEKWEFEGNAFVYSDRFKGHSIFVSRDNHHADASAQFGSLLGKQLKARGLVYTPHYIESFMGNRRRILVDAATGVYRYDQLVVLKSTQMPAVLFEAGSIINRDEELVMSTPERHAVISAAIVDAVDAYCAGPRVRPASPVQVKRAGTAQPAKPTPAR